MPDKISLEVVVNGQPTVVEANPNSPLRSVKEKALQATGNIGQSPDQWEFRDAPGAVLDENRKIGDLGTHRVFLNLQAGVGG
jgi:hypothetical protein